MQYSPAKLFSINIIVLKHYRTMFVFMMIILLTGTLGKVQIAEAGQISDPSQTYQSSFPPTFTQDSKTVVFVSTELPNSDVVRAYEIDTAAISDPLNISYDPGSNYFNSGMKYSGEVNGQIVRSHPNARSDDGRFRAYRARGDNGEDQVFLEDGDSNTSSQISDSSVSYRVSLEPGLSADGRYVTYVSTPRFGEDNLVLYDRITGVTIRISDPTVTYVVSFAPAISADGRYIAYVSTPRSGEDQVYVYDRDNGTSKQVSDPAIMLRASVAPTISDDGRFVTYLSSGTNHQVYITDQFTGEAEIVSDPTLTLRVSKMPVVSPDGKYIAYISTPRFEEDSVFLEVNPLYPVAQEVEVDFSPGNNDLVIDLCTNKPIPITVFGSNDFDVNNVDVSTLRFAEASARLVGKKDPKYLCNYGDKNNDGIDDLTCQFLASDLSTIDGETTTATIQGSFLDEGEFFGEGPITVESGEC